jgi:hypothetical protein
MSYVWTTAIGSAIAVVVSYLLTFLMFRPIYRLLYPKKKLPDSEQMVAFTGVLIVGSLTCSPFLLLIPMCVTTIIDALNRLMNGPGGFSTYGWFMGRIAYWWIGIIAFVCISGIVVMFKVFSSNDGSSSTKDIPKFVEDEHNRHRM